MLKLTHTRAVFLMVVVTLLWSIAGLVTRHLEQARSFEVTFWRSFFTLLSLLVMLPAIQGRGCLAPFVAVAPRCGCQACVGRRCSPPSWWP